MFHLKKQKLMTYFVFGVYIVLLIWLILFKFSANIIEMDHIRNINLIPFKGSMIVNGQLSVREILYNVLVFIPFGVYIGALAHDWSFVKKIWPILTLSILFELLQFVFAIGASDITDVIGNTLGGIIGLLLFIAFKKISTKHFMNIINIVGLIIEIIAVSFLVLLFVGNM